MASTDRGIGIPFILSELTVTPADGYIIPADASPNQGWYGGIQFTTAPFYQYNSGYEYDNTAITGTYEPFIAPATNPSSPNPNQGWYSGPIFEIDGYYGVVGASYTQSSVDLGLAQAVAANVVVGGTVGTLGSGTISAPSNTASGTNGSSTLITVGGNTGPQNFLMQAYESGGSCTGKVQRIWLATGGADLTGSQYTGTRCSPTPGTFSNFSILASW